jgi:hypothetical protein
MPTPHRRYLAHRGRRVFGAIETRRGDLYDVERLNADLRALFKLGYFADVRIKVEDSAAGKIVTFLFEEKPAVKEFVIEGNNKIKDDKINETIDLKPNTILSVAQDQKNIEKIRQLYEADGFFMVDIHHEIEPLDNKRVKVIIRITEYRKDLHQTHRLRGQPGLRRGYAAQAVADQSRPRDELHGPVGRLPRNHVRAGSANAAHVLRQPRLLRAGRPPGRHPQRRQTLDVYLGVGQRGPAVLHRKHRHRRDLLFKKRRPDEAAHHPGGRGLLARQVRAVAQRTEKPFTPTSATPSPRSSPMSRPIRKRAG